MIIDVTNGDAPRVEYWKAERLIIKWATANDITFAYIISGDTHVVATYKPAGGAVLIDVTDFVRTYPERRSLLFADETAHVQRGVIIYNMGIINPAGEIIPEREDDDPCKIIAPQVMIEPFGNLRVQFEMWSADGYSFSTGRVVERPSDSVTNYARVVELENTTKRVEFWHLQDIMYKAIDLHSRTCEKQYACVEWVSFTGETRRHIFEIAKAGVETGEVVSLENILNEWTEIKGRVDGFSLRLEDLDRYDLWYYSDLITSSRVRVTIDGVKWYDVHVDESAYTLPESNAGKLSTLEIPVKFRKYDAVSL